MLRLRQVALVARDRDQAVEDLRNALDSTVSFHDPGVEIFGLRNAVMPVGDMFLEVVSPFRPDATAARYLDKRKGDGGYMVILQTDDLAAVRARAAALGARIVFETELPEIATIHLHPRDTGGILLSFDWANPPTEWRWAGPAWRKVRASRLYRGIGGVELESANPIALATRWSNLLARPVTGMKNGAPEILLDDATIRFVPMRDDRGEGLHTVLVKSFDLKSCLDAARSRGFAVTDGAFTVCGTRFRPA